MEKVYKAMRNTGAANIAIGIIVIAVGVSAGIVSIVTGANLLKKKSQIMFKTQDAAEYGTFSAAFAV